MDKVSKHLGLDNPRYSENQRKYMKNFAKGALPFLISGFVFIIIALALVLSHTVDFSKIGKTRAKDLSDLQSRIGYVLKFSTPGLVFLFVCIHWTIHQRVRSPAMDPLSNHEMYVLKMKNILQNTLEQLVMSVIAQLILVTHLSAENTLRYIPALSFLFILGRITFWLGYPQFRSFGMITTMVPTLVVIGYNCVKFFDLYF